MGSRLQVVVYALIQLTTAGCLSGEIVPASGDSGPQDMSECSSPADLDEACSCQSSFEAEMDLIVRCSDDERAVLGWQVDCDAGCYDFSNERIAACVPEELSFVRSFAIYHR